MNTLAKRVADYIYIEKDYSRFKKLIGNRDANKRKETIKKKILKVGYIMNPIVVNEKMEIIDGQGRFEALKELDLPIYYCISKGAGLKECQEMNLGTTNWTMMDFVNSYAEQGNDNYIRLKDTIFHYKQFTWKVIYNISCVNYRDNGGDSYNSVNTGNYSYSEEDKARVESILDKLKPFISISKKIGGRREMFLTAIAFCIEQNFINEDELARRILLKISDFAPTGNIRYCLEEIERACNYRRTNKIYIVHQYDLIQNSKKEKC